MSYFCLWTDTTGSEDVLPLRQTKVNNHHSEIGCKAAGHKIPFQTAIQEPDFRFAVGYTCAMKYKVY